MRMKEQALFLEWRAYRRRRLRDAAVVLPLIWACLLCLPMLLLAVPAGEERSTATGLIYVFVLWVSLIAVSAVLARLLGRSPEE